MLAEQYFEFRSVLDRQGALLTYCGLVSERVLGALGETLKHKMAEQQTTSDVSKRVFSIFVEQVQNVMRYSEERAGAAQEPRPGAGLVMVGTSEGQHFVLCGNLIPQEKAPRLKERLDHLAELDSQGLRELYREKLRQPAGGGEPGCHGRTNRDREAFQPADRV